MFWGPGSSSDNVRFINDVKKLIFCRLLKYKCPLKTAARSKLFGKTCPFTRNPLLQLFTHTHTHTHTHTDVYIYIYIYIYICIYIYKRNVKV